jgi:RecA/RadA recombinase
MTINIIGDTVNVERLETGLWSFDRAFENQKGEIGFPLGKGVEIFGVTNCGKSTIVYGLSGLIASAQERFIALADLEGFDPDFLVTVLDNAGYSGDLQYIQRDDDEEVLDELVSVLRKPSGKYVVGILDSIGAISPISEQKGAIGEANMGRRAMILAQFTRKCLKLLRRPDAPTIFMINHEYPRIGGMGSDTPGGEVKKYLASIRIKVKRVWFKGKYEEYPDGSYVIEGTVIKNRWGYKDRKFWLFVLAGKGIHKGLTAMYDGMRLGIVGRKRVVSIGDEKFGYLKNIVQEAQDGNEEFFEPFYEALRNYRTEEIENVDEN